MAFFTQFTMEEEDPSSGSADAAEPGTDGSLSSRTLSKRGSHGECFPIDDNHNIYRCSSAPASVKNKGRGILCRDTHDKCSSWMERGECMNNPGYMLINCPMSCSTCSDGHMGVLQTATLLNSLNEEDDDDDDEDSSNVSNNNSAMHTDEERRRLNTIHERLLEIQEYVYNEASKSGKHAQHYLLHGCKNRHSRCTEWSAQGECNANPRFMHEHCTAACMICHEQFDG